MTGDGGHDEHVWCRERLLTHVLGLLDEQTESRIERHLASCPNCPSDLAQLQELRGDAGEASADRGHIPAAMIARWDRTSKLLSGAEGELVRQHLERCPSCRNDIETLGQREAPVQQQAPEQSAVPMQPPAPVRPTLRIVRHRAWAPWTLGAGAGALATAALMLLMLRPPPQAPVQPGAPTPPGPGEHAPPSSPEAPRAIVEVLPWVAPAELRGAPAVLEVQEGTQELVLAAALPEELPAHATAFVEIYAPSGDLLARTLTQPSHGQAGTLLVRLHTPEPLAAGVYRAVVRPTAGNSAHTPGEAPPAGIRDSLETYFEVRVQAHTDVW